MSKAAALASVLILTVAAFLVGRATSSPSASQPVATPVPTATPLPLPVGAGGRPIAADGGNTDLYSAPPGAHNVGTPPTAASWYVKGVILTTGQDVAPLLNAYGDKYHVWPVGLAATLGVESALNPNAERWAGGLDNSCGLAQQIITNVTYYTGIQSPRAACNWEEVPQNSIYLEARLYSEYFAYQHNCVSWPYAYGMYNGGPGLPCSFYYNATGDIGAHLQVFIGWYDYALAHWQSASPPPPPPTPQPKPAVFPRKAWCAWSTGHHRGCPAIYEKHGGTYHLTWAASLYPHRTWLRGKLPYTWDRFTRARKPSGSGYMNYHWVKGTATCWVKWHRCSVKRV